MIFFRLNEESRPKRNLKRKRAADIDPADNVDNQTLDPTPAKTKKVQFKDPDVQVGLVKSCGTKSVLVPENQPLSLAQTLEHNNLVTIHKGTRKPKGKGYSRGKYGEETIVTRISPTKANGNRPTEAEIDNIPDLIDPNGKVIRNLPTSVPGAQIIQKRRKRGSVCTISRKTPDAKRKEEERYVIIY